MFPDSSTKELNFIQSVKAYDLRGKFNELPLFPDNCGEILVNLGGSVQRKMVGTIRAAKIATGEVILSACRSKGVTLESDNLFVISARIHPQQITSVFPPDAPMERDAFVSLGVFPKILTRENFDQYLIAIAEKANPPATDFFLEEAVRMIRESHGEIKIKDVCEALNISKSSLEQKFSQYIGLTPKEFCKVEKIKNFITNYRRYQDSMNLTQLTFKSGYYDQSHLIKDFRYFMDTKPGQFMTKYGCMV